MIKVIGAVCIIASCAGMGFSLALTHKKDANTLQQLLHALEFMLCELPEKMPPLPMLCRDTANQTSGIIRKVFTVLAETLDTQQYPDAEHCMRAAIDMCTALPDTAKAILLRMGQYLSRFDLHGQISGLSSIKQSVQRELSARLSNMDVRIRSYKTLGLCAGAALAILFI